MIFLLATIIIIHYLLNGDIDDKKDIKKIFEEVLPIPSTVVKNKKNKKKLISPILTAEEWQAHQ